MIDDATELGPALARLGAELGERSPTPPELTITGGPRTTYDDVARVLDAARAAGWDRVYFGADR